MYVKYIDEWLHPCIRKVDGISMRSAEVEEDDGTVTEGAELYDPTRGSGYRVGDDNAAFRWFSSWAAAIRVLDKLRSAIDGGSQFFDMTVYGEEGEGID